MGAPIASIVSAGATKFGVREGLYTRELFAEAAKEAFDRCPNLDPKRDIQALFVGMMSESYEHQAHIAPLLLDWIGLLPIPAFQKRKRVRLIKCRPTKRYFLDRVRNVRCCSGGGCRKDDPFQYDRRDGGVSYGF